MKARLIAKKTIVVLARLCDLCMLPLLIPALPAILASTAFDAWAKWLMRNCQHENAVLRKRTCAGVYSAWKRCQDCGDDKAVPVCPWCGSTEVTGFSYLCDKCNTPESEE